MLTGTCLKWTGIHIPNFRGPNLVIPTTSKSEIFWMVSSWISEHFRFSVLQNLKISQIWNTSLVPWILDKRYSACSGGIRGIFTVWLLKNICNRVTCDKFVSREPHYWQCLGLELQSKKRRAFLLFSNFPEASRSPCLLANECFPESTLWSRALQKTSVSLLSFFSLLL